MTELYQQCTLLQLGKVKEDNFRSEFSHGGAVLATHGMLWPARYITRRTSAATSGKDFAILLIKVGCVINVAGLKSKLDDLLQKLKSARKAHSVQPKPNWMIAYQIKKSAAPPFI